MHTYVQMYAYIHVLNMYIDKCEIPNSMTPNHPNYDDPEGAIIIIGCDLSPPNKYEFGAPPPK